MADAAGQHVLVSGGTSSADRSAALSCGHGLADRRISNETGFALLLIAYASERS